MIAKNLKNQYKSIKAPADLKDRILEATEATAPVSSKKRVYKYGSRLEFKHIPEMFDDESKKILDFVIKYAEILKY